MRPYQTISCQIFSYKLEEEGYTMSKGKPCVLVLFLMMGIVVFSHVAQGGTREPACSPNIILPYADNFSPDPIVRAGSVVVLSRSKAGMGFLYQEGGDLFVGTVRHLLSGSCVFTFFPGVKVSTAVEEEHIVLNGEGDRFITFPILGATLTMLKTAIADGVIQPYYLSDTPPEVGDLVAIPQPAGGWTYYVVTNATPYYIRMDTTGILGIICNGSSGAPVVATDTAGNPTNEVVAVVARGTGEILRYDDGRICSRTVLAYRP